MNETQKRIKAYKEALPGLKERITAVALLFVMSIAMLTSASFAWLTLSQAPEVRGVGTTVTANGNLEIALSKPDGAEPGKSAVGDSSAAEGQSVVGSNVTWGNLVNLSDPSYGLSSIVLRPAMLGSGSNLLQQPLRGVDYGKDGRLEQKYNEDYRFTNWHTAASGDGYFEYSETPRYGVRAISYVDYEYRSDNYNLFRTMFGKVEQTQQGVETAYDNLTNYKTMTSKKYIDALGDVMANYMIEHLTAHLSSGGGLQGSLISHTDPDDAAKVPQLYHLLCDMYDLLVGSDTVAYSFRDALVEMANAQVFLKYGNDYVAHTYDAEKLLSATTAELAKDGIKIDCLTEYKRVRDAIYDAIYGDGVLDTANPDCFYDFYRIVYPNETNGVVDESRKSSTKITSSKLEPFLNKVADIGSCKIYASDGTYTVSQIAGSGSIATGLNGKTVRVEVVKGLLVDFEKLTGCYMQTTETITLNASISFYTAKISAETIYTSAKANAPSAFQKDMNATRAAGEGVQGEYTAVAKDVYGMALDFWVRTNTTGSYLVLQGNVLAETKTEPVTITLSDGTKVQVCTTTVTVTPEEGEPFTYNMDVYQIGTVWYDASSSEPVYDEKDDPPKGYSYSKPMPRMEEIVNVFGYEGDNRVWPENSLLDVSSTTQGNGSCYVFYADDPGQQANSLRLLKNLRVAFIDSNEDSVTYGRLVAVAGLDTDNPYEESGKVTVPLVLINDNSAYLTTNEDSLAIMPLERNKATRLTAVVYLDGREMTNADVLAANDIQGQLNIQFGSTADLKAVSDEKLELATRTVSALAKKHSAGSYPQTNQTIEYTFGEDNDLTVDVQVTVMGELPETVVAFFMRKVNDTQGSRESTFTLNKKNDIAGGAVYEGSYTFTAPGTFVLRAVQMDGVDYSLSAPDEETPSPYPQVVVKGASVTDVKLIYNNHEVSDPTITIRTGGRNVSTGLRLKYAATNASQMPNSVKLMFMNDAAGTQVTATLRYDATEMTWKGTANFTSSGVYTLRYVITDVGGYQELDPRFQKTVDISLGMTVRVTGIGEYESTFERAFSIAMQVEIYNDQGNKIRGLNGVRLYYTRGGSAIDNATPDMRWDEEKGCYTGYLQIPSAGIYRFHSIMVGDNSLTNTVDTPPLYTFVPPDPVEFVSAWLMPGEDYLLSTSAVTYSAEAKLKGAEAATVWAILHDADTGNEVRVPGQSTQDGTGLTTFRFALPRNDAGYQSGDWILIRLELINVYGPDDKLYINEDDPYIVSLSNDPDRSVKVVNIDFKVDADGDKIFGENGDLAFLATQTVNNAFSITVTDQNGEALQLPISDFQVQYALQAGSSAVHGGYTASHLDSVSVPVNLTSVGEGRYQVGTITLKYAGVYAPDKVSIKIGGTTYTFDAKAQPAASLPTYTLKTALPTVTITSINVNGTQSSNSVTGFEYDENPTPGTSAGTHKSGTAQITNNGTRAVVYFACKYTAGGLCSSASHEFTQPSVTLTLSGLGDGNRVSLVFKDANGASAYISENKSENKAVGTVGRTGDGNIVCYIGGMNGAASKTPAKTLNITGMTLYDSNGNAYTVANVPGITIINDY